MSRLIKTDLIDNRRGFEQGLSDLSRQDRSLAAASEIVRGSWAGLLSIVSGGGSGFTYDVPLGAASGTFNQWAPYRDLGGYTIWRITAPSDFVWNDLNVLYTRDRRGKLELAYENMGQAQSLGNAGFTQAFTRSGTGAAYIDNTAEANTDLGTPFSALAGVYSGSGATHYLYLGLSGSQGGLQPFQGVSIGLQQAAAGLSLFAEYYSENLGWTSGVTPILQEDATGNLARSGRLQLLIPVSGADRWIPTHVNGASGSYVRLGTTSAPSTIPAFYFARPSSGVEDLLQRSTAQVRAGDFGWTHFNGEIFATIPDDGVASREGVDFIKSGSSVGNRRAFFAAFHRHNLLYGLGSGASILLESESNAILKVVSGNSAWSAQRDITTSFLTSGSNIQLFITNNDYLYLGCAAPFDHLAFALSTRPSSVNGIALNAGALQFEYQSGSEGNWGSLIPYAVHQAAPDPGGTNSEATAAVYPVNWYTRRRDLHDIMRWMTPPAWVSGSQHAVGTEIDSTDTRDLYYIRWKRTNVVLATVPRLLHASVSKSANFRKNPPPLTGPNIAIDVFSTSSGSQNEGVDFKLGGQFGHLWTNLITWDGLTKSDGTPQSGSRGFIIPRPDLLGIRSLHYDWSRDTFAVGISTSGSNRITRPIIPPSNILVVSQAGPGDFTGNVAIDDAISYLNALSSPPSATNRYSLLVGPGVYRGSVSTTKVNQIPSYVDIIGFGRPVFSGAESSSVWGQHVYHQGVYSRVSGIEIRRPWVMSGPSILEDSWIIQRPVVDDGMIGLNPTLVTPIMLGVVVEQVLSGNDPTILRRNYFDLQLSGSSASLYQTLLCPARVNNHMSPFPTNAPFYFEDNTVHLSGGHPMGVQTIRAGSGSIFHIRRNSYHIQNPIYDDWHHVEMVNRLPEYAFIEDENVFAEMYITGDFAGAPVQSRGFTIHGSATGHSPGLISQVHLKNVRHILRVSGSRTNQDNWAFGNAADSGVSLHLDNCVSVVQQFGGSLTFWDVQQGNTSGGGSSGTYVATYARGGYLPTRSGSISNLFSADQGYGDFTKTLLIPTFHSGTTPQLQQILDESKWWGANTTNASPRDGVGIFAGFLTSSNPVLGIRSGNKLFTVSLPNILNL